MPNTITYATYLAVMALACAHGEVNSGLTNLDPLERADMVYDSEEFQAQAFSEWVEASDGEDIVAPEQIGEYFEAFYKSLDEGDRAFLEAAIIA